MTGSQRREKGKVSLVMMGKWKNKKGELLSLLPLWKTGDQSHCRYYEELHNMHFRIAPWKGNMGIWAWD